MNVVTTPFAKKYLFIWRTELLFYTPERRKLAGEWTHVCFTGLPEADEPTLINSNLKKPLPFPNGTFDAVYSVHVVEHQSRAAGGQLLKDAYRLLKPGGICRISTPDLEFFARDYLNQLQRYRLDPDKKQFQRYQWALLNVLDQAVRRRSGGEMIDVIQNKEYVQEHLENLNGDLLVFIQNTSRSSIKRILTNTTTYVDGNSTSIGYRLNALFRAGVRKVITLLSRPWHLRLSRENNLWYHDSVSLIQLFEQAGFRDVVVKDYKTSGIDQWERYNFDQSAYGDYPVEPSLFIEGVK